MIKELTDPPTCDASKEPWQMAITDRSPAIHTAGGTHVTFVDHVETARRIVDAHNAALAFERLVARAPR